MTVKELIAHLQTFDQDLEVYTGATDGPTSEGTFNATYVTVNQFNVYVGDEGYQQRTGVVIHAEQ